MGIVQARVKIGHYHGGELRPVDVLVDTGAAHSVIDSDLLESLNLSPQRYETFELADGDTREWGVGTARFVYMDKDAWCPVVFGPKDANLLGATTLEILGLSVDPVEEQLTPIQRRARPL